MPDIRCEVDSCTYNEDNNCRADDIEIDESGQCTTQE